MEKESSFKQIALKELDREKNKSQSKPHILNLTHNGPDI